MLAFSVGAAASAFAALASRRAAASETARGVLADEQAALRRVATLVARQPSPQEVFAAVTEEAGKLLHLDRAHLVVFGPDQKATVVGAWNLRDPAPAPVGTLLPLEGDNVTVRVFRTHRPARVDVYTDAEDPAARYGRSRGVWATAGCPVLVGGRVWGALTVGSSRPDPLPAGTESRIGAFTELVAMAISNADARTEIELLAEEQAALRRVATLVATGKETGEVFTAVAREVSQVMHLPIAAILRYEDDGEAVTVLAAWSDRPHPFQPGTRWPVERAGLAVRVRRTGHASRAGDYTRRRGAFAAAAREAGLHSLAGAPIVVDGAVWGLMTIASPYGPVPDHAENRLAQFTELLGTAIANTQSRMELSASRARIVAAADEARRRLERDLHDGLQQRLVSLTLSARTIAAMASRPADQLRSELAVLADGLGTSLDDLREISHGIHPALLSEAGLGPALKSLARRCAVPVALDLTLGPRPEEHLEVAAYYVASEALANAAKHAHASAIDMRACVDDGALTVRIRDDGVGGADPARGSGIIGLKDRVEALGGTLSVVSPPGRGTTVDVRLPAAPASARP
jgi:signal transduction histidine kinase